MNGTYYQIPISLPEFDSPFSFPYVLQQRKSEIVFKNRAGKIIYNLIPERTRKSSKAEIEILRSTDQIHILVSLLRNLFDNPVT